MKNSISYYLNLTFKVKFTLFKSRIVCFLNSRNILIITYKFLKLLKISYV